MAEGGKIPEIVYTPSRRQYLLAQRSVMEGLRIVDLSLTDLGARAGDRIKVTVEAKDDPETKRWVEFVTAIGSDMPVRKPLKDMDPAVLLLSGLQSAEAAARYLSARQPGETVTTESEVYATAFVPEKTPLDEVKWTQLLGIPFEKLLQMEDWREFFFPAYYFWLVSYFGKADADYPFELADRGVITKSEAAEVVGGLHYKDIFADPLMKLAIQRNFVLAKPPFEVRPEGQWFYEI